MPGQLIEWGGKSGGAGMTNPDMPSALPSTLSSSQSQAPGESALQSSDQYFASAFEHASIGMALVAPDGRWLQVNRALCEMLGYSEAEILRTTFQDLTHPDDLEADLEHVRRMLAGDISSFQMEKRYFHGQGRIVWSLLSVSLVRDAAGRPS